MIFPLFKLYKFHKEKVESLQKLQVLLLDYKESTEIKVSEKLLVTYGFTSSKELFDTVYTANIQVYRHLRGVDVRLIFDADSLKVENNFSHTGNEWGIRIYNFSVAVDAALREEYRASYDRRLMRLKDWCLVLAVFIPILKALLGTK